MKIIDKLLRLHCRQSINDNVKSILYFKHDRFFDLFFELQMMTRPAFTMPQFAWDYWLYNIMPRFVSGDSLRVLGYEIRILPR